VGGQHEQLVRSRNDRGDLVGVRALSVEKVGLGGPPGLAALAALRRLAQVDTGGDGAADRDAIGHGHWVSRQGRPAPR
ncbi:MAG: hypothetical protein QOH29_1158, partial [Actinomycetota bacterium]|nr:hypothetical protein [Actinomycetota bacterium]